MTDNTRMVDLPWVDGTTHTVPEWTVYEAKTGGLYVARDGGYSFGLDSKKDSGNRIYPHYSGSVAVRIFTEAPEPPVKVDVPTGLGAIVSLPGRPQLKPGYVLTRNGWRGLLTGIGYLPDEIANELRRGARVLFEGIDEDTP